MDRKMYLIFNLIQVIKNALFIMLQAPDIMLVDGGNHVGPLLQHNALQGLGAARPEQRQVHPQQGSRRPHPLRRYIFHINIRSIEMKNSCHL